MKALLIISGLFLVALSSQAQGTFTEKLRQRESGKGTVVINQSAEIEQLVNNNAPRPTTAPAKQAGGAATHPHGGEAAHTENKPKTQATQGSGHKTHVARTRHKAQGFRICIFTGGNSRQDKVKAMQMGQKCREKFGELAVYTSFISPRWVTHVGDFRTRQDAQKYINLIRKQHFTYEVRIVASEVNLPD